MSDPLSHLAGEDLHRLALAMRTGRLLPPYAGLALRRHIAGVEADAIADGLRSLGDEGFTPAQLARMLEALAADRAARPRPGDVIELAWTGPKAGGVANRDTGVVVRELFSRACESVLIAGYAIYQGHRVFRVLADRMDLIPELRVRMYLDVRREPGDGSPAAEVAGRFSRRFVDRVWPGRRLPEVFYDPRSLDPDPSRRASLHAKCVVADSERSFVSSANFTEAAQLRNIEVGVVIRSRPFAEQLVQHFQALAAEGLLKPIPPPA